MGIVGAKTPLERAKQKWSDKMVYAGPRWKSAVTKAAEEDRFAKGMAAFLGLETGIDPLRNAAWKKGIERVSAADFQQAVKNKAGRWANRLKFAFTPVTPVTPVVTE